MDDLENLRPQITKVGQGHYRKLAFEGSGPKNTLHDLDYSAYDEYDDEEPDCESNIETVSNGFKTRVEVPADLIKFICGKKMQNKLNIERETNTQIKLPKLGARGPVVVTGTNRKEVSSCRHRIKRIVESSRQRLSPTHFVSFPLYNEAIIKRQEEFKSIALEKCKNSKGVEEGIFTVPQKLHLTIGVMTLLTESEVESAASLLETCFEEVIRAHVGEEPIVVNLKGVDYMNLGMNDDPSKANVLYAKVYEADGGTRLQVLADAILKYFVSKGLAKEGRGRVKLHATLMTTKLSIHKQASFDAREIIEVFQDFEFGEHHLDCIHLSQRGVFDPNGHYHCCKSVALP